MQECQSKKGQGVVWRIDNDLSTSEEEERTSEDRNTKEGAKWEFGTICADVVQMGSTDLL